MNLSSNAKNALNKWLNGYANHKPHSLIKYEEEFKNMKLRNNLNKITVYRGLSVNNFSKRTGLNPQNVKINQVINYNTLKNKNKTYTRGLRSWTTSLSTASNFAGKNGFILKANVTKENIFLNTNFLKNRTNNYNVENEIIVKPSVQKAVVIKKTGGRMNANHPYYNNLRKATLKKMEST